MSGVRVMLVARRNDPDSVLARLFLAAHRVDFTERELDAGPAHLAGAGPALPVLVVDGEPIVGFDPPRFTRMLGLRGEATRSPHPTPAEAAALACRRSSAGRRAAGGRAALPRSAASTGTRAGGSLRPSLR